MAFATHLRVEILFGMHNNIPQNHLRPYSTGCLSGSHMTPHFIYFRRKQHVQNTPIDMFYRKQTAKMQGGKQVG